jgi:hypothetical protein
MTERERDRHGVVDAARGHDGARMPNGRAGGEKDNRDSGDEARLPRRRSMGRSGGPTLVVTIFRLALPRPTL